MRSLWKIIFPDVIVFRVRRRQTQNNLGISNHEQDASVPLVSPAPAGSATACCNAPTTESNYRIASDAAQLILPVVGTVAGAIPLAGPSIQAAISGLLAILRGIDSNMQNKKDLAKLESRLHRLSCHIHNAPTAGDPGENSLRNTLISVLQDTSSELEKLNQRGIGSISRVTQAITGCSNDINEYLLEYSALSQMQIGHKVDATFTAMQTMQLPRTNTLGVVTLVDATGYEHPIVAQYCTSFQQLTMMLQVIFQPDSIQARVQRRYLETGEYDLCIDHGTEVTRLTSDRWPSIEVGTKIVMSMVVKQRRDMQEAYQCHLCKTWNNGSSTNDEETCLIDCGGCGRRFQVSVTMGFVEEEQETIHENIKHRDVYPTGTTTADMQLIRNWHIQRKLEINKLEIYREMCRASGRNPDDEDDYDYSYLYDYSEEQDEDRGHDYSHFCDYYEEGQDEDEMGNEGEEEILICPAQHWVPTTHSTITDSTCTTSAH